MQLTMIERRWFSASIEFGTATDRSNGCGVGILRQNTAVDYGWLCSRFAAEPPSQMRQHNQESPAHTLVSVANLSLGPFFNGSFSHVWSVLSSR